MTREEEQRQLLKEAERLLGGSNALAEQATELLSLDDPSNDDLVQAGSMLRRAAGLADQAASKRRRAKD